jgi:hypothetical protein
LLVVGTLWNGVLTMSGRDRQDVDTSVGRGEPAAGADVGPTSGTAGGLSADEAIGLGGTEQGAGMTGAPADDADRRRDREDPGGGFGTGLETGNTSRGNSYNSASRVDTFNVPGERRGGEPGPDDRDELRGRNPHR